MLDKIKKLRGRDWREIRVRGAQTLTAFAEQIGVSGNAPTDRKFWNLFDKAQFNGELNVETLLNDFQNRESPRFFPVPDSPLFFRKKFPAEAEKIIASAEQVLLGKFDLLGYKNLDFGAPVDWHLEPISGKRSPLKHWKRFDELGTEETGDKKIVWELNRLQHFFTLGAAFRLTGDERFAAEFVAQLNDWAAKNPPARGVNWISSLEIAFRAISILWALRFFKNSPSLTPQFFADAVKTLILHGRHIEKYLSTYYSPNTHLTGEALGLYYLGTFLPALKTARRWRETGAQILIAELDRQILPDGVYFEQSTWYARYTVDFYMHFLILARLNNDEFVLAESAKISEKLQLALDFLMFVQRPDGTTPIIGDDDGGQMLPVSFARGINDFRACLANGAMMFKRGDYKFAAGAFAVENFWLFGKQGFDEFAKIAIANLPETTKTFSDGGYFTARSDWTPDAHFIVIDGGKHGAPGAAHAHADALAFDLSVAGRATLVDAGTYSYHESAEIRDYFRVARAHNTLTIDGASSSETAGKFAWKSIADARIERTLSAENFDYFCGSHEGFSRLENRIITHRREMLFMRSKFWILRDSINAENVHDYELNFHFAAGLQPEIMDGKFVLNRAEADKKNGLKIFTFGNSGGEWQIVNDWTSVCYGRREKSLTARFCAAQLIGNQEFVTFLLPCETEHQNVTVTKIQRTNERAFEIEFGMEKFTCGNQIADCELK